MNNKTGKFVISLDFELMWGVRDKRNLETYGENIAAVKKVIPLLLDLFDQFNIRATFATVGFLFFENKSELIKNFPASFPSYQDKNLSPYNGYINNLSQSDKDIYHFAPDLIGLIVSKHELATHTLSHYYCLEDGQTKEQFEADLQRAVDVARERGITISSIVFPRNQVNHDYFQICKKYGLTAYRGNENNFAYRECNDNKKQYILKKIIRFADTYLNTTGRHCYTDDEMKLNAMINIPSSCFLRPYSKKFKFLEPLKKRRIGKDMEHAAKSGKTYHLWWHPHNFGKDTEENLNFLKNILKHYSILNNKYGFQSFTMHDVATSLLNE